MFERPAIINEAQLRKKALRAAVIQQIGDQLHAVFSPPAEVSPELSALIARLNE